MRLRIEAFATAGKGSIAAWAWAQAISFFRVARLHPRRPGMGRREKPCQRVLTEDFLSVSQLEMGVHRLLYLNDRDLALFLI